MKHKVVKCIIFVIIMIVGVSISILIEQKQVKTFDMSDYQKFIEEYSEEKMLGEVLNEQIAKKKAIETLIEKFGNEISGKVKDYRVYFDSNNQVWLVKGVLSSNWLKRITIDKNKIGGTPSCIIQKEDGRVLAVWHSQ